MPRDVSTNAEMQAVINAGGVVTYDGRIIRKIADLPSDEQILLDFPEYSYTFNAGNARGILGYRITGTPTDQDTLIFDGTDKKWIFGASSGGGGSINIREVDGTPTIVGASVLEFDQGDGFIVSNPSGSVARVRINAIPDARLTSNVTLGGNTFSGTGSIVRATSPSIAKLANLTTNGFVKTSGSDGTLIVDTSTYLTTAVTSLAGTSNQIIASASTGSVTLSLPSSPHIAGTLFVGSTSGIQFGDGGGISGTTTGFIVPVSDGVFRLGDSAGGGSPHIILGSNNSSFVRIKRNGTSVAVRLGDDSADGNITAANGTFSGVLTSGSAPTTLTNSAGKILSAALNTVGVAQGGTGLTALGSALQVLRVNSGGNALEFATLSGGGSPGGSDTQLQFNSSSSFAGISGATSDGTNVTFGSGNARMTSPRVTTQLSDSNGNAVLRFSPTTSATQSLQISNNTATNPVSISVNSATAAASSQAGSYLNITAASATAGTSSNGAAAGGGLLVTLGSAAQFTSGTARGGDLEVVNGLSVGTADTTTLGQIIIPTMGRYDNPSVCFRSNTVGLLRKYGIGLLGGGSTFVINAPNIALSAADSSDNYTSGVVSMNTQTMLAWTSNTSFPVDFTPDLYFGRRSAATFRFGQPDTDLGSDIIAQKMSVQGALTGGTANQSGKDFTIDLSQSKGTGIGGGLVIRTTPPGSSSSTVNAYVTAITIPSVGGVILPAITAPSTPSANNVHFYAKVNGLYYKGENGTEVGPLGSGGGGSLTDGDKGDITVSSSGSVWTIDNTAVTYAKIQNVTDNKLIGRSAGSNGSVQEITVGSGLSLSGGTLTATGGGGGTTINSTDTFIPYRSNSTTFADTTMSFSSNVVSITRDSLGTTPATGLLLINNSDSTSSVQQNSPAINWASEGWSTTSAANRLLNWRADLRPLVGTTNPASRLVISQSNSAVSSGAYAEHSSFEVAETGTAYVRFPGGAEGVSVVDWPGVVIGPNFGTQTNPIVNGIYAVSGGSYLIFRPANRLGTHGSGFSMLSGATLSWGSNSSSITTGTNDTFIKRRAAASITFGEADADGTTPGFVTPVAQTLGVQNIITATNGAAAANFKIIGPLGTGNSTPGRLQFQTGGQSATSGTTAQTAIDRLVLGAVKVLSNNTTTTIFNASVASNTVAAGTLSYAVEVFDGTDLQIEEGSVSYHVTNKNGTIANNTVSSKFGNQNVATSGTLTVAFTITAANPALIQINANSSLTPSTGYPRVTYKLSNLTQQAVSIV